MFVRRMSSLSLLLLVLLFGVTSLVAWTRECSQRTINGRYGFITQGTVLITSPQLPVASVGVVSFDGLGSLFGTYSQSIGGAITKGLKIEGTYQVNPDCTFTFSLTAPNVAHRVGVITGEGMDQELHAVFTDPSSVAFVTYEKTPQGRCSSASLKGDYGLFGHGTILNQGAAPALVAQTGTIEFDGTGGFSGRQTQNTAGVVATFEFAGTYTVNTDCSASLTLNTSAGTSHQEAVITGQGESKGLETIVTDSGRVITNTLRKQ